MTIKFNENTVPTNLRSKPLEVRQYFAAKANEILAKGGSSSQAISSAAKLTEIFEKSIAKPKAETKIDLVKAIKGNLPEPLFQITSDEQETFDDDGEEYARDIVSLEFDKSGRLAVSFDDGTKMLSKNSAPAENITQQVTLHTNPVFDYVQMNTTANLTDEDFLPGMLTWNEPEDCLNVVQNDGTVLQVGLENYIEVRNRTESLLTNGTVVRFSGVNGDELPQVMPMIGDGSIEPLYIVGVITEDIPDKDRGRATVLGKVRDIDTTGSSVGEVWQQGDILWVSPTQAGKFTKVRPTAPNINISVAAVLKVHATEGILLVRPTIFPRLFNGKFSSSTDQIPLAPNTPYAVTFEITDYSSGVILENNSHIKVLNAGMYSFDFRLQVTSTNSSQKNIWIWARKNGVDVPESATKVTMTGNGVEIVPSWEFTYSLLPNDYFQLMYAVDNVGLLINSPAATAFCPGTPSAVIKVRQINL